jgi:hypothetical protein
VLARLALFDEVDAEEEEDDGFKDEVETLDIVDL